MKILYPSLASAVLLSTMPLQAYADHRACSDSTRGMYNACRNDLRDDRAEGGVICTNLKDPSAAEDCRTEVSEEYAEGQALCKAQRAARRDLCDELGEAPYDVTETWIAANFVDPNDIGGAVPPNPWLDLTPGASQSYFGAGETIEVTVTDEIKLIEGVRCRTVTDLVTEDGLNVEDTDDWYAQDIQGNVWYCGEIALNFEFYEGDEPVAAEVTDVDGSWKGFRDGAQPGIVFHADPVVGNTYRQEMAWGDAEDAATVLSITADGLLDGDDCEDSDTTEDVAEFLEEMCDENCLVTLEFSPIEPDVEAHKYYAPGVGLLAEVEDGECIAVAGVIEEDGEEDDGEEDEG